MRYNPNLTIVALAAQIITSAAAANGPEIDSREYKLMLHPEHFAGNVHVREEAVSRFVDDQLEQAVRGSFGDHAADELARKGLHLDKNRSVRFWDTATCVLFENGFALRSRVDDKPGSKPEITLKFRSPDLFLAAEMRLNARPGAKDVESKLEEDVGAFAVRTAAGDAIIPMPRSSRSQFSRSTKCTVDEESRLRTLKDIERLYPKFEEDLRLVAGDNDMSEPLQLAADYAEILYKSSKLDFARNMEASFSLTIWYEGPDNRDRPAMAEISFAYDTDHGAVAGEAARRSRDLFVAMQDLNWAEPGAPTKTALTGCPD